MSQSGSIRTSVFVLQTPLLAAVAEGFFADEGVQVSFERTTGSDAQRRQLASGDIDVIQTAADNAIGPVVTGTADLRIFHVADLGIDQMVVAREGIESWEALRGGRVAVDSAGSGYAYVVYSMLDERGIAPGEYEALSVGGPGPRFEHLCNGTADVGLLNPHMAARARDRGLSVLARCADSFPGYPNLTLAATETTVRDRRPELAGFGRAVDRGVRWAHDPANAGRAIELLMADRSCGEGEARELYESERALRAVPHPTPEQVRDGLDLVTRLRERMGGGYLPVDAYYSPVTEPTG
jgi:NitT/TauT family transport system substrate-binding protein